MSKSKERKKVTDKKLNKELFVNFKLNADYLEEKKEIDIEMANRSNNERAVKNTESFFLWSESHLEIMKGNGGVDALTGRSNWRF